LSEESYAPFSKWEGWDSITTNGVRPIQGKAEIFWISNGKIIESASSLDFHGVDEGVAKTLGIFELQTYSP
jgi:hypothetical protein